MSYDWESEYETFTRCVSGLPKEEAAQLLDQAAAAAKAGNLREAAQPLEKLRAAVAGAGLFKSWDNGIWCFTSLINHIRRMSPETTVPKEYQYFLDAIPSASYNAEMTKGQKAFWYGNPKANIYGEIRVTGPGATQKAGKGCLVLLLALPGAAFCCWLFR